MKTSLYVLLICTFVGAGCVPVQPTVGTGAPNVSAPATITIEANLTTGCVENFDPAVDYFPAKVTPTYATGWTVEYHNYYKIVTLPTPWNEATETFQYLLVQCGTPTPEGYPDLPVLEIPVQRVIT